MLPVISAHEVSRTSRGCMSESFLVVDRVPRLRLPQPRPRFGRRRRPRGSREYVESRDRQSYVRTMRRRLGRRYLRRVGALAAMADEAEIDEAPRLPDAVLAVGLAVAAQLDLRFNLDNSTHYGSDFATAVVVAIATLSLAWRRTWPFATLCVVAAAIAVPELFGTLTFTLWGHFVPLLVAAYTVARWCSGLRVVLGVVIVAATITVVLLGVPATGSAGNVAFAVVPATA